MSFFFGSRESTEEGAKTKPPTDGTMQNGNTQDLDLSGQMQAEETLSLEEAKAKAVFVLPEFHDIPSSYQLNKIELFHLPNENKAAKVRFTFRNESNKVFWVTMTLLQGDMSIGSGANGAKVEEI
ncbi:hypothetical protein [Ferviditalea candida]|uniref:Uncharacterized protein n=1 Tax=Ferviditalea candida TaxID=3108399 RepID=A0ABU5ZC39_9BACL|nr:hypothetical protein [Paenibacillaceae bacterium T2]